MEFAFGGVLVAIFLAGFGYLATEIKAFRESTTKGFTDLRVELTSEIRELTDRYISHLEWHQRSG